VVFSQEHTDVFRVNSTPVITPLDIRVQFSKHEVFSLTRNESWELSSVPASPNIIREIKSYSKGGEFHTGLLWGNRRERIHLEDPGLDWTTILKWIFTKWDVGAWTGLISLGIGIGGGQL